MRERLRVIGSLAAFWIVFMVIARGGFLLYNHDQTSQLTALEIAKVMLYGSRMDASMTGYLLAFYGLILCGSVFHQGRWVTLTITFFTLLLIIFSSLAVIVDLELYRHWGFRLNTTPFFYMGSAAAGSADSFVVIKLILIFIGFALSFSFLYFKTIRSAVTSLKPTEKRTALILFVITALMFIPIRGGFTVSTMNVGKVYFHKTNNFANHAGINVMWHFLYSLKSEGNVLYPENYFNKQLTHEYFQLLYPKSDSTAHVLSTPQPNIILIIVESFTANVIEALGGKPGVTPQLNKLCKKGILFDNFYASGDRTDKGLVSILSGYPAQTQRSIIKYPGKTQKLPYVSRKLEQLGYQTSFVYGGDADFANFRSFLTYAGFSHITSDEDFSHEISTSKWGVHDQYIFEQASKELDTTSTSKPFFKVVLTLSSHEPFDVPLKHFEGDDEPTLFINSCYYTDKYLGEFIDQCKQQSWWNNTLVVITADHGHRLPDKIDARAKERFRIPLLLIGGAIQKDSVVHTIGGQTDLANTLLAQLDKSSDDFLFSKNLLGNHVNDFAVYIFNDGYGYIDKNRYIVYDNQGKLYLREEGLQSEEDKYYGKAYMQQLYTDYNAKK